MISGWFEAVCQRQLVVRIERRCMTVRAAFTRENALASDGGSTPRIRVPGRLERIDVQSERIQEFVRETITRQRFRDREFALPSDSARKTTCNMAGVPHQILDPTVAVRRCVIDVLAIFEADEIGNLHWKERASIVPCEHVDERRFQLLELPQAHCRETFVYVVLQPRHAKLAKLLFRQARGVFVAA